MLIHNITHIYSIISTSAADDDDGGLFVVEVHP